MNYLRRAELSMAMGDRTQAEADLRKEVRRAQVETIDRLLADVRSIDDFEAHRAEVLRRLNGNRSNRSTNHP